MAWRRAAIGTAAIVFTDDIKELITGMILGDGNLRMIGKEGRLQIEQKDREFLQLLWQLFSGVGIVGAQPRERSHFLSVSGQTYNTYAFETFTHPFFT